MKFLALSLTLLSLTSTVKAAIYYESLTYYSNTIDPRSTHMNVFDVAKFDIAQATLASAMVKFIRSTMNCSITVANRWSNIATIMQLDSDFMSKASRQFTSDQVDSQTTINTRDATTGPVWQATVLQPIFDNYFNIKSVPIFTISGKMGGS
jgi:hypothetical protein